MVIRLWLLAGMLLQAASYEAYVTQLADDPVVRSLNAQSQAQAAQAEARGALGDPQLVVGIDNLPVENPAFNRYLPTAKVVGVTQPFAIGRDATAAVHRVRSRTMTLRARYALKQLEAGFFSALVQVRRNTQQLANLAEQRQRLTQIAQSFESRLAVGEDVSAEQYRIAERQLALDVSALQLRTDRQIAEHTLMRLVGEIPTVGLPHKRRLPWTPDRLYPTALSAQDLRGADAAREAAAARNGVGFALQLLYKQREAGSGFSGEDWVSLRGVLTVPLWGGRDAEELAAGLARRAAADHLLNAQREWTETMRTFDTRDEALRKRIALEQQRTGAIERTYRAQKRRYESGGGTYAALPETELRRLQTRFTLLGLEADRQILAARQNSYIME